MTERLRWLSFASLTEYLDDSGAWRSVPDRDVQEFMTAAGHNRARAAIMDAWRVAPEARTSTQRQAVRLWDSTKERRRRTERAEVIRVCEAVWASRREQARLAGELSQSVGKDAP